MRIPPRTWYVALVVSVFAVGSLALPAGAQPESCPGNSSQVDITLDFDAGSMTVDPLSVEIFLQPDPDKPQQKGQVCWYVSNLGEGQTLHIERKEGVPDLFPGADRTIKLPVSFAKSGNPAKAGTWTYSLWVTQEGSDEKLLFTDPEVVVQGSAGGTGGAAGTGG